MTNHVYIIGLIFGAMTLLATGCLALYANPKGRVNKWFFAFSFSCALWQCMVYGSDVNRQQSLLIYTNLSLLVSNYIAVTIFGLAKEIIYSTKFRHRTYYAIGIIFLSCQCLTFTQLSITRPLISVGNYQTATLRFGYYVNLVFVFGMLLSSLFLIYLKSKRIATKQARNQFYLFLIGGSIATLINGLNELYYISFRRTYSTYGLIYDYITSTSLVLLALFIFVAIIKHGLFDLRRAAARAFAYFTFIASVSVLYGAVIILLVTTLFKTSIGAGELAASAIAISFASLTLPFIKNATNRLTDRLFYRKAYDLKNSLDQLTSILVSYVELDATLSKSLDYICQTIEPAHAYLFAVQDGSIIASVANERNAVDKKTAGLIANNLTILENHSESIIFSEHESQVNDLQAVFQSTDSGLLLRLTTTETFVGILLLGPKKSGGFYTKQDEAFLKIASKNLSLAIQNALHYEKIRRFAETLQSEVVEATAELRESNKQLTKLAKTKDDFISMASHQLQPQLSASRGFIEMMGRTKDDDEELLGLTKSSIMRMTQLVNDMLNVTKIQAGDFILEPEPIDLVAIVQGEINNLKFATEKHSVKIKFDYPSEVKLEADPGKIREAIFNLLDNAVQYSHKGSTVSVQIIKEDRVTKLTIADRGIGIPKDEQDRLFTNYFRASNAYKKRPNGTGIGLYVTKKICEAHGYEIAVESKVKVGTKITMIMPKARVSMRHKS